MVQAFIITSPELVRDLKDQRILLRSHLELSSIRELSHVISVPLDNLSGNMLQKAQKP